MNKQELDEIVRLHGLWLKSEKGGKRANLRYANLRGADLQGADLRGADLWNADLQRADLQHANLRYANLRYANLRGADLRGADLDYSCFPLWCGGLNWIVDEQLPQMLCAFICSMKCDDEETKEIQKLIRPYAEKSHRASEILEQE